MGSAKINLPIQKIEIDFR